jgi:beta-glucosidase-like glycosyl hydrolase
MAIKSQDGFELENSRKYKDDEEETLRPSLEEAYGSASSSDEEDVDEFDPLNYDAGTLKRKKRRKGKSNLQEETSQLQAQKSWIRKHLIPSKFCWWMIALFFATVLLLLSAGGIWGNKPVPSDGQSPPWYPSPIGGTDQSWEEAYKKAAEMVRKMDVIEKVNITTGTGWMMGMCVGNTGPAERVGFPSLCLQDGPLGIRWAENITAFPAGVTVGATWNKDLMYQRGVAHGLEARLKGINVILGPGMGPLGRTPLGGRNWEGFGTDPVLQGIAAAQTIKGIQSQGVIATAKHFVGNEQEHFRQSWEWGLPNAISSNIDDRTLHEMYGWPFAESIRAGVGSVMCSYNQVNNSYACQNSKLMNGILKDEMGFQGFIQSDWLAQRSGVASALAGLDMSMPGDGLRWQDGDPLWGGHLTRAVFNGSIPAERLNDMAVRTVAAWYQMGQDNKTLYPDDGPNFSSWTNDQVGLLHPGSDDKAVGVVNKFVDVQGKGDSAHGKLARQIAAEGIVLLKNEDQVLPLRRQGGLFKTPQDRKRPRFKVSIIGEDARENQNGINSCADRGCNTGTLASGWGSGAVDFPYLITPLDAITEFYDENNVEVQSYNDTKMNKGLEKIARDSDLCMVFTNADGGEGYIQSDAIQGDRNDLWPQNSGNVLIEGVSKVCGNGSSPVVVVIHSVGPVLVEKFVDIENVKAIVLANLPGQESGNALADVLFGDLNPSGRLPYTIGKSFEDYGPSAEVLVKSKAPVPQQNFSEGLLIDYRHFDFYNITPRYEFGYGLSYTSWKLSSGQVHFLNAAERYKPLPAPRPAGIAPPVLPIKLPDVRSALFPSKFRKLRKYIYPYIDDTTDLNPGGSPQYPPNYTPTSMLSPAGGGPGGNPDLYTPLVEVRATLTNTGDRAGKCVVQVYISLPQDYHDRETGEIISNPVRVLRNFDKYEITNHNGRAEVNITLTRKDLSYWSVVRGNWVLPQPGEGGNIAIEVGFSSRDLPIKMTY